MESEARTLEPETTLTVMLEECIRVGSHLSLVDECSRQCPSHSVHCCPMWTVHNSANPCPDSTLH